jgi:hypothetical protein
MPDIIEKPPPTGDLLVLLGHAREQKLSPDQIGKLLDIYERVMARSAQQQFNEAMARFQNECPPIAKTSKADIASRSGARFTYTYAELQDILTTIRPALHTCGLSVAWDGENKDGSYTSICRVRHIGGHEEQTRFVVPISSAAGMSEQQKVASAGTFADRNSLIRALGIRAVDDDNDGAEPECFQAIDSSQHEVLKDLILRSGTDLHKFLAHYKIERIDLMPKVNYQNAVALLVGKIKHAADRKEQL